MKTIEELLVAITINLKNGKATQLTLEQLEKKFFGTAKAAETADRKISSIGKNHGISTQVSHATQLLSQITHSNNGLHMMHTLLTKIGKTGPLVAGVGAVLAGFGAYNLSEQVGKFEYTQRLTDFSFGEDADKVRKDATNTAREFGTNELDLLEGFRQMTKKGVGGSMKDVLVLQEAARLEQRTLTSAVEAIADAQVGEFKRLKEYGIKGSSPRGSDEYKLLNAATGEVQRVKRDDPQAVREVVMAMITEKYGGALEATKETIPAKMQNVKGALWEGNESMWSAFAKGAVDPIYEAWQDMSEDLIGWVKDPAVQEALYNIGRAVGEGVLALARLVQSLGVVFDLLLPALDFIMTTLGVLFDVVQGGINTLNVLLTGTFSELTAAWNEWAEIIWLGLQLIALKFGNAVLDTLEMLFPGFDQLLLKTADFFVWVEAGWDSAIGWVADFGSAVSKTILDLELIAIDSITYFFTFLSEKWEEAIGWVSDFMTAMSKAILDLQLIIMDGVAEAFRSAIKWVKDMLGFNRPSVIPTPGSYVTGNKTDVTANYYINSTSVSDGMAASRLNSNYLYR